MSVQTPDGASARDITAESTRQRFHRLRVRAIVDESHDARSFTFDLPAGLAERFAYRPGQFLTLRLPLADRSVLRCYSMSSTPGLDAGLRITVKRVAGGRGSNWICDHLRPGDEVELMPPAGLFTPASLAGDFLLLAGGSGITPVFSILRAVLQGGSGRVLLLYANRDERSVIFRDALRDLASSHAQRLVVIHWLDSVQGLPSVDQIAALARPWRDAQAFLCGPAPFMAGAAEALDAVGMPADRVHQERFVSLPDQAPNAAVGPAAPAPDGPDEPQADTPPTAPGETTALTLEFDGQSHALRCGPGQTVLAAAIAAGLQPPYVCQSGVCGSCMCQVLDGSVHLLHNEALDARDLARAWTLACQAVPTSTTLRVKFPS